LFDLVWSPRERSFSGCVSLSGRAQPLIPALDPSGDFHFPL
jgi:hypothetical protein